MNTPLRNPLHLYRALLREADYLFHPTLQNFHAQHIRWSFRRQLKSLKSSRHGASAIVDSKLPSQQESQQLRRGRQYLYTLRRANQGYVGALENVLKMAYARKGKRRREILKGIMTREPFEPNPDVESNSPLEVVPFSKEWKPPDKFSMMLKKQKVVHKYLDRGGTIMSMPSIPEKNKSGVAFPQCRIKKLMKAWYAKSADSLASPLGEEDWMEAYKIGAGQTASSDIVIPNRRPRGTVAIFTNADDAIGQGATEMDNKFTSNRPFAEKYPYRIRQIIGNPHRLTTRFLRRMFLRTVVNNAPIILSDPETGRIAPRWDATGVKHNAPKVATESQKVSMFD